MKKVLSILVLTTLGCGVNPGMTPDAVEVTGRVTRKGRLLSNLTLHLQPTGSGVQAMLPVKNGEVRGSVIPGTYTYYLEASRSAAASIPEKYRSGFMDRQVQVAEGTILNVILDD